MKKSCFVLLCAALLVLAPSAFAGDGPALSLDGLFARLIAIFSGLESSENEMGAQMEPFGQPAAEGPTSEIVPPNNNAATGETPEMGPQFEPFG